MKTLLRISISIIVTLMILPACGPAQPAPVVLPTAAPPPTAAPTIAMSPTPYPGGKMIWRDTIVSKALAGNLLGDEATRAATVYLPASYNTSQKRYPVLYLLQSFRVPTVDPLEVSKALDRLIGTGQSMEVILVFIDGFNKLGGSWYLNSPTIGDWDTFISQELVNHVDSTYRTIADREARAITGCSMGGYGALYLAFTHPDVFSVAAANSLPFYMWGDEMWEKARSQFTTVPGDVGAGAISIPVPLAYYVSVASGAAPNPAKPPFYLDMPFAIVGGQAQIVPEVKAKIDAIGPGAYLQHYLAQPVRLLGLMIYQGAYDDPQPAQAFDQLLNQSGVKHSYLEVQGDHCGLDWSPVLKFVADELVH